jgi:hypothetical protein
MFVAERKIRSSEAQSSSAKICSSLCSLTRFEVSRVLSGWCSAQRRHHSSTIRMQDAPEIQDMQHQCLSIAQQEEP